jgi:tRNA(fMet)-specific endonuclease VapC
MDEVLVDTDILSEALKAKDATVLARTQQYLSQYGRLAFSAITFYEVMRGMVATRATKQLANFLQTAANSDDIPVSIPILSRAADLWATATAGGHPRDDADLIIAATA